MAGSLFCASSLKHFLCRAQLFSFMRAHLSGDGHNFWADGVPCWKSFCMVLPMLSFSRGFSISAFPLISLTSLIHLELFLFRVLGMNQFHSSPRGYPVFQVYPFWQCCLLSSVCLQLHNRLSYSLPLCVLCSCRALLIPLRGRLLPAHGMPRARCFLLLPQHMFWHLWQTSDGCNYVYSCLDLQFCYVGQSVCFWARTGLFLWL